MSDIKNGILKQVSIEKNIIISPVDGTITIAKAKNVFREGISRGFKERDMSIPSNPTPETQIKVYELVADATLLQMFKSLSITNIDTLLLTQHQIVQFSKQYPYELRPPDYRRVLGHTTFALLKIYRVYYVACISAYFFDKFRADLCYLDYIYPYGAKLNCRLIVPSV